MLCLNNYTKLLWAFRIMNKKINHHHLKSLIFHNMDSLG